MRNFSNGTSLYDQPAEDSLGEGKTTRLPLTLQQESYDLWGDLTCALVEFFFRQIGRWMRYIQELIVGDSPCLGHSMSGLHESISNNRGRGDAVFFEENSIEHTARAT